MYKLSARQSLLIALLSAIFAAGTVACLDRFSNHIQPNSSAFTEAQPAGVTDPSLATDEQNNVEVYRALSPGVANITSTVVQQGFFGDVEEGQGSGSGSVIDDQGHILTNYHVIEGAERLSVSLGGNKKYPAKVVGGDPDTDLAVIQIDAPRDQLTVVPLGDSDRLVVGQKVLAIGNPFGLDRTLTTGVISGLQRPIRARNGRPIDAAIQTDASINPGNSGGPLLDKFGRMIGINSQILSPAGGSVGVGFAIPVNTAKRVVPQLIQNGSVSRPKMGLDGVGIEKLKDRGLDLPIGKGLLVYRLSDGGPAAAAGIHGISRDADGDLILGDVITSIDGTAISDLDDLYRCLDKKQIGQTVQVLVYRDGKTLTLPVRLAGSSQP